MTLSFHFTPSPSSPSHDARSPTVPPESDGHNQQPRPFCDSNPTPITCDRLLTAKEDAPSNPLPSQPLIALPAVSLPCDSLTSRNKSKRLDDDIIVDAAESPRHYQSKHPQTKERAERQQFRSLSAISTALTPAVIAGSPEPERFGGEMVEGRTALLWHSEMGVSLMMKRPLRLRYSWQSEGKSSGMGTSTANRSPAGHALWPRTGRVYSGITKWLAVSVTPRMSVALEFQTNPDPSTFK
jgi:hypothetical protein